MALVASSLLIFLIPLIIYLVPGHAERHRRQIADGTNRNVGIPQPLNSYPLNPSNNAKPSDSNNNLYAAQSQAQMPPVRSRGYYDSPSFQPPFLGEKPGGWFGTNHPAFASNQQSELDKNKLAAMKTAPPNNPQANPMVQKPREDSGPFLLQKIAKQYASKGFKYGQFETRQGSGSVCSNFDSFDGYVFGHFSCPLPPATGMNQLDQFCCGYANYQFCCNAQEFSQSQLGAYADPRMHNQQLYAKKPGYPAPTKKLLAIIIPIISLVVLTGIGVFVFFYYKRFRNEQTRARKLSGTIRLDDTYSIIPQEPPIERNDLSSK